jgi:hypothetical protein
MSRATIMSVSLLVGVGVIGCGGHARSPDEYRDATAAVLATRSAQVRACYDGAYKADPSAQGTVTVQFKVEADTGKFVGAQVVSGNAPDPLKQCILKSFDGALLAPADAQDGDATFQWEFVPPKPAA